MHNIIVLKRIFKMLGLCFIVVGIAIHFYNAYLISVLIGDPLTGDGLLFGIFSIFIPISSEILIVFFMIVSELSVSPYSILVISYILAFILYFYLYIKYYYPHYDSYELHFGDKIFSIICWTLNYSFSQAKIIIIIVLFFGILSFILFALKTNIPV